MTEDQPIQSQTVTTDGALAATPAEKSLSRRHLMMGAGMLAIGGTAFARMPKRRFQNIADEQYEALFPKTFGDWRTLPVSELVMPPDGDLSAKLYQHILTRTYVNGKGDGVMLLAAYNSEQVNNVQVHRPEVCYKVSGFNIADSRPYDVQLGGGEAIPARIVRAERGTRMENILYWTRIGDDFPQSWLEQRIAMTKANLAGFYADGLLLRASVIDNDENESIAVMTRFFKELAAHSGPKMRDLVFRT